MILKPEETMRFYRIWFRLLHYVNEQRHVVPSFPAVWDGSKVETDVAYKVRQVVWADDALRAAFIAENPAGLPPEDLALVASWDFHVAGDFYVFRSLKKYTVLLSRTSPTRAYGVLGLFSPFEDLIPLPPPTLIQTVLLPFEDKIIYDGLLSGYNVIFGSGIRSSLNDEYRDIKERDAIITSLLPAVRPAKPEEQRRGISVRNAKLLTAFQKDLARSGLSLKMIEQHTGNLATFAQSYLLEQNPPRGLIDITQRDLEAYIGTKTQQVNPTSFKRFVRFLRDSGRMNWGDADDFLDFLKRR
jgi:hypothetical protein